MSNQRKQIILNEITFWKKNKLLPEQYCDFLMTLYTEGNNEDEKRIANAKHSVKGQEKRKGQWMFFVFPLLAIILCTFCLFANIEIIIFSSSKSVREMIASVSLMPSSFKIS